MTREDILSCMRLCEAMFPKKIITPEAVEAWEMAFLSQSKETLNQAILKHSEHNTYPPTVAQLNKELKSSFTIKGTKNVPENDTVSRAHARLSKRVRVGDNNINNNSKEDSTREGEKTAAKKPVKFTPPTQEEVTAYCQEKGYTFSPVTFFAHYEANGWVQGKGKPIKNWKACCVTWQQREQTGEFNGRSQSHGGTHNDTVQHQHNGGFDDMEDFG